MFCWALRACNQVTARLTHYKPINLNKVIPFRVSFSSNRMEQADQIPGNNNVSLFSLPHLPSNDFKNFNRKVTFKALQIPTIALQGLLHRGLKRKAYKRPKFNFVRKGEDEDFRFILLDPTAVDEFETWKTCPVLQEFNIVPTLSDYDVILTYDDFNADEILRAVLPLGVDVPTAFSRIGHIAHINLRDDQLPHKEIIGQVWVDKIQGITTVVNKTTEISNQFRVFKMEVLAGEDNFIATVREHGCTFQLDFSKVYWNPRLSTEHERVVKLMSCNVVFDVFAGIGPFAIPAAKSGCQVYANDLNPDSYVWLMNNAKLNRVEKRVKTFNMDGRAFITTLVKDTILQYVQREENDRPTRMHMVMNLPASAVEFLDAFRGLLSGSVPAGDARVPPMSVHCYCFSKEQDIEKDAVAMVENHLGCTIKLPNVHNVRNVAPKKEMMCVTFEMPTDVLWADPGCGRGDNAKRGASDYLSNGGDGDIKKQKLE